MTKFLAGVIVGLMTVFGPVAAQAQKSDQAVGGNLAQVSFATPSGFSTSDIGARNDFSSAASLESSSGKPTPAIAWLMAAGFLGLVVLRRTRSGPMI